MVEEDGPCPGCSYEGIGSAHADDFGGYDCQPVEGRTLSSFPCCKHCRCAEPTRHPNPCLHPDCKR